MAQHNKGKAKPPVEPDATDPAALLEALRQMRAHARAVERERDALRAELAAARAQIAEIEGQRDRVVERIDLVIGSLGHLMAGAAQ